LGIAFPALFAGSDKGVESLYVILGSGAYAVFEAFCMNVFGTSLGKRLYGITITRTAEEGFALRVSFQRAFAVWVRGLGMGFPLVSLFTLGTAHRTLTREGQTSWDRDFQCTASHKELSFLRWLSIFAVWLLVLAIYVFLNVLANTK
jgi:hypothetical protein